MNNLINLTKFVRQAITDYIKSGQADQLILARMEALENRPRCAACAHWDRQTMYCLDALSEHGTTYPSQLCDRFKRKEAQHD